MKMEKSSKRYVLTESDNFVSQFINFVEHGLAQDLSYFKQDNCKQPPLADFIKDDGMTKRKDETDAEFLARFRKHHPTITEVDRGRRNG